MRTNTARRAAAEPGQRKHASLMSDREKLAAWMIENGFATGHGDTFDDLLKELALQIQELHEKIWELEQDLERP